MQTELFPSTLKNLYIHTRRCNWGPDKSLLQSHIVLIINLNKHILASPANMCHHSVPLVFPQTVFVHDYNNSWAGFRSMSVAKRTGKFSSALTCKANLICNDVQLPVNIHGSRNWTLVELMNSIVSRIANTWTETWDKFGVPCFGETSNTFWAKLKEFISY